MGCRSAPALPVPRAKSRPRMCFRPWASPTNWRAPRCGSVSAGIRRMAMAMRLSRPWSGLPRAPVRAPRREVIMSSAAGEIAQETREQVASIGEKYKYGFVTDIEMERAPRGLSDDTVRFISAKKGEPEWMLEWRLGAFRRWGEMKEPNWA